MRASLFSVGYRIIRFLVIQGVYLNQRILNYPKDLETAVLLGDHIFGKLYQGVFSSVFFRFKARNTQVNLHDLTFPSPITFSAFKDDLDMISAWVDMGAGGGCVKTLMEEPRLGNPRPRMQEVVVNGKPGFINALGLPAKGIYAFLDHFSTHAIRSKNVPIGISIGGSTVESYKAVFDACEENFKESSQPYYYEVNISCPNIQEGHGDIRNPEVLGRLLKEMRQSSSRVIGVKVSPDSDESTLKKIGEQLKKIKKSYINIGNTSFRKCEEVGLNQADISIGGGGMSGAPLYQLMREKLEILKECGLPIIATGGIETARQVKDCLNNGATLIGMASALVKDPYCIPKINQALSKS